jgi:hypothetical protein
MQNKHKNFKICTLLQKLSNMQKIYIYIYIYNIYNTCNTLLSNFRSDIMAPRNEFILHSAIFNNNKKSMQIYLSLNSQIYYNNY